MEQGEIISNSWRHLGGRLFYSCYVEPLIPTSTAYMYIYSHPDSEFPINCPSCKAGYCFYIDVSDSDTDWYCATCYLTWTSHMARCLACGRWLELASIGKLHCFWCGQDWDEDLIILAYETGDEYGIMDYSTPKGDNE